MTFIVQKIERENMKLEDALQQLEAGRKAKRLLGLWPAIEAKLAEGVSHAEILAALNANGIALTERTYKSYLYRYRKRRRGIGRKPAPMHLTETTTLQSADVAQAATSPVSAEAARHKRPPTFDYNPRGLRRDLL